MSETSMRCVRCNKLIETDEEFVEVKTATTVRLPWTQEHGHRKVAGEVKTSVMHLSHLEHPRVVPRRSHLYEDLTLGDRPIAEWIEEEPEPVKLPVPSRSEIEMLRKSLGYLTEPKNAAAAARKIPWWRR